MKKALPPGTVTLCVDHFYFISFSLKFKYPVFLLLLLVHLFILFSSQSIKIPQRICIKTHYFLQSFGPNVGYI